MSQRRQCQVMLNVGAFRFFAAQKLAAGGQIEEELAHFHDCSRSAAGRFNIQNFTAVNRDLGSFLCVALSCRDCHPAHTGNAGQSLAAKAHRENRTQILGRSNFARRVAFQT